MSDPWTDAWAEAEATAPPGTKVYYTLELLNDAFPDPIRLVTGVPDDMNFTLEVGAPFDSGASVLFTAVMFTAEKPSFEDGKTPECVIAIDNVARILMPHLEAAVIIRQDITVNYREYLSDDLTAPAYGPVTFTLKQCSVSGTQVRGTLKIDDLSNRKFPSLIYTVKDYPGLQP